VAGIFGKSEGKKAADITPKMPMRALTRTLLRHVPVLLVALMAACASSPDTTGPTEESHFGNVLIRFRDFRGSETQLALANESTLDRVDYYSAERSNAGLKVTSDEIMNALVEVFENEGFWEAARPGEGPLDARAPTEGNQSLHGLLSVKTGERSGWITFRKGLAKNELELFGDLSQAFIAIYNSTAGYQRIDNPEGEALFKKKDH
jgi:hypothetical protein